MSAIAEIKGLLKDLANAHPYEYAAITKRMRDLAEQVTHGRDRDETFTEKLLKQNEWLDREVRRLREALKDIEALTPKNGSAYAVERAQSALSN